MSIKVMSAVWENSSQTGGSLLVLLALADFAGDNGECYPAVKTLAEKARMSERNARYVLRGLEAAGEIATVVGGGRHGTSGYLILVGAKTAGGQSLPGAKRDRKGGNPLPKRGQPIAPEPSGTVIEPPVEIPAAADAAPATQVETFTSQVSATITKSLGGARITDRTGKRLLSWAVDVIKVLDENSHHDAAEASSAWLAFVGSDAWQFKGADQAKWATSLGDWLANGRRNGNGRAPVVATVDRTDRKLTPEEQAAKAAEMRARFPKLFPPVEAAP